jgi:hypothetical protein
MRAALIGCMVACLVIVGGQAVFSQEPPAQRGKFQDRIEWMTMWKLMESLELDKPTADKIYEIRRKYLDQKKELVKEINAGVESLKQALQRDPSKVNEALLTEMISSVREKRRKLEGLLDEQFGELATVLSVRQQAKLVVFMKDFQEELRAMFRPPGPGGPPPPPRGEGFGPPLPPAGPPPLDPDGGPAHPFGSPPPN